MEFCSDQFIGLAGHRAGSCIGLLVHWSGEARIPTVAVMNSGPQMLRRDSDSHSVSILLCRWAVGIALGTGLIAVSSPLFVRSYLPLNADPVRGIWTLPSGTEYRWRSEGYANTSIGPHGMPGKKVLQSQARSKPSEVHGFQSDSVDPNAAVRIALWGDSQAVSYTHLTLPTTSRV